MRKLLCLLLLLPCLPVNASGVIHQLGGQFFQSNRPPISVEKPEDLADREDDSIDDSRCEEQPNEGLEATEDELSE